MKKHFPLFIVLILLFSCNSSRISKQDLLKENQVLKEKLNKLQTVDTSNIKAVVELSNMNVVYRGVTNPIKISVPNAVKIEASAPGLKKIDEFGNYRMHPGTGRKVDILINTLLTNGDSIKKIKTLRILDIKRHFGTFNGNGCYKCVIELTKEELIKGKIGVKFDDFLFDWKSYVSSFKIKLPNQEFIKVDGNSIPDNLTEKTKDLKVNDLIQIFDINFHIIGINSYRTKRPSPIKIKIIE